MINQVVHSFLDDAMLLVAAFLFASRFPRRQHFLPRVSAASAAWLIFWLFALSLIWAFLKSSPLLLYVLEVHSLSLIATAGLVLFAAWDIDLQNNLQCVSMAYALQNLGSNVNGLIHDPVTDVMSQSGLTANCGKHLAVFLAVYALGALFFVRRFRRVPTHVKPSLRVCVMNLLVIILSCIVLQGQFFRFPAIMETAEINTLLHLFNVILCVVMMEMGLAFLFAIDERDTSDRLAWMLEQKRDQYEAARATAELIRVKYHDLRHYLHSQEEQSRIGAMLSEDMMEGIRRYDAQFDTGCSALDVVLTEKALRCIREQIMLSVMADGSALGFMRSVDIYALFSNALDNAIEAVASCEPERRIISMNLHTQGSFLLLQIENYCENRVSWRNNELVSSKTDGDWHGYGTRSIGMIVEKYGGTLQMGEEDHLFTLNALFPLSGEQAA